MNIRGLIFDFNGVIVNDEPVHCQAFQKALKAELGIDLSRQEYFERYLPYDNENCIRHFMSDRGLPVAPEVVHRLVGLKSAFYRQAVEVEIPVLSDTVGFIEALPAGFPLAIASGADRDEIEFVLRQLRLHERFPIIVAAGEVGRSKPDPEAFLTALEKLQRATPGLDSDGVVVFEDSFHGIKAAHAAGMRCVALATSYPVEKLLPADLVVESLSGWDLRRLQERLTSEEAG
jgi:beta-phosphoglucomutase